MRYRPGVPMHILSVQYRRAMVIGLPGREALITNRRTAFRSYSASYNCSRLKAYPTHPNFLNALVLSAAPAFVATWAAARTSLFAYAGLAGFSYRH